MTPRREHPQAVSVFREALGDEAFAALPAPLAAFHGADGPPIWRGQASIDTGTHPLARLLQRMFRLPPAGHDVPVAIGIERIAGMDGASEVWTRNFGGARFSSRLSTDGSGALWEALGPMRFRLGVALYEGGLALPVTGARCLGIPLPSALLPLSEAREFVDETGRFRFDIKLTLPVVGLLTHYRGWLVPAATSSETEAEAHSAGAG